MEVNAVREALVGAVALCGGHRQQQPSQAEACEDAARRGRKVPERNGQAHRKVNQAGAIEKPPQQETWMEKPSASLH